MQKEQLFIIRGSSSDAVSALNAHAGLGLAEVPRKGNESALRAVNPLATVPTYVAPDGFVLTETAAILNMLARSHGLDLLPTDAADLARLEEIMSLVSSTVYSAFLLHFRPDRSADDTAAHHAIRAKASGALVQAFDHLERLVKAGPFVLGKQLTTVDFHVLVALRWAQRVQPALVEARPRLRALFDTLRDMPFYRTAFAAN